MFSTQGPAIIADYNSGMALWFANHPPTESGILLLIGLCALVGGFALLARAVKQS